MRRNMRKLSLNSVTGAANESDVREARSVPRIAEPIQNFPLTDALSEARRVDAARATQLEGPPPVTDTPEPTKAHFRSDVTVDLVKSAAADSDVLFAARVSTAA